MKKLFASVSYSFNNFYSNLNIKGQIIFSLIIFLLIILFILLFIVEIIQKINDRKRILVLKEEQKNFVSTDEKDNENDSLSSEKITISSDEKSVKEDINVIEDNKQEVLDIALKIEEKLREDEKIRLTNFEEDQEKTAIISIDELIEKAKELKIIEDEKCNVNYIEKYNLSSPIEDDTKDYINDNSSVKAFKVSQVISPIYGVKKDISKNNN